MNEFRVDGKVVGGDGSPPADLGHLKGRRVAEDERGHGERVDQG